MMRNSEPCIYLTHKPTGIRVRVQSRNRYRSGDMAEAFAKARRYLISILGSPKTESIQRNYYMTPDFMVGIRQDGRWLAKGSGELNSALDGKLTWIDSTTQGR